MRFPICLLVAAFFAAAPIAHADAVTYNLLFAPQYPVVAPPAVVGTFTLSAAPPGTGPVSFVYPATSPSPFQVQSLSFNVGPEHFDLSDLFPIYNTGPATFEVDFNNGNLTALVGQFSNRSTSIAFGTQTINGFGTPLTVEFYDFFGTPSVDFASITPATLPTPEPSSLALLGTGLLSAVSVLNRKVR